MLLLFLVMPLPSLFFSSFPLQDKGNEEEGCVESDAKPGMGEAAANLVPESRLAATGEAAVSENESESTRANAPGRALRGDRACGRAIGTSNGQLLAGGHSMSALGSRSWPSLVEI